MQICSGVYLFCRQGGLGCEDRVEGSETCRPGPVFGGTIMADTLRCPNCSFEIEVSTVLAAQGRELETQKQELELAVNRRLDEERDTIRQEAMKQAQEENRLHDRDQEKLIDDLRRQIGDLKRTSELGSQQAQGEVMELELEELLRHHFPQDGIEAIPRGTHGGDVLQRVHDHCGKECGTILWEAKRTKAWNDGWLPKLRDDQPAARAHLAALLSAEMPKDLASFGCRDGVRGTSLACLAGISV